MSKQLSDHLITIAEEFEKAAAKLRETAQSIDEPRHDHKRLVIHPSYKEVLWDDQLVSLSKREYELVEYLVRRPGVWRTNDELLDYLNMSNAPSAIGDLVRNVRRKFKSIDKQFEAIRTRYNFGYTWKE